MDNDARHTPDKRRSAEASSDSADVSTVVPEVLAPTGRQQFTIARRRRQTVVFSFTAIVMAILLVVGSLVGFGVVPVPFFKTFNAKQQTARVGSVPCPPEGANPVKLSAVSVRVLNGTDRAGLAGSVAKDLKSQGVKVQMVGNAAGDEYRGTVKIVTGVSGVLNAYTVSLFFDDSQLILDARHNNTVDITLGTDFEAIKGATEVKPKLSVPLESRPNCLPLN